MNSRKSLEAPGCGIGGIVELGSLQVNREQPLGIARSANDAGKPAGE